ncbi:hypothetical protein KBX71_19630 [Micromonospora sp. D93]|uniref:hypothetical protein n=1 Tax=Micromonospora sp. D93 TaxID=2824886 RepID=UPI001B386216|nr:hypothetical protein [Micromonospora sp. D93]MBQ1020060.1 hypothetical protein [Micromonospora sp. D93]
MSADPDEALLRDLVWPLVREFSPAERDELFPLLSAAYFADPKAFGRDGGGGGPLRFGLPELAVIMTPALLAAMSEVVRYVVTEAALKGVKATADGVRRLFGLPRRPDPALDETAPLTLTAEQWIQIRRIVERVARQGGVPANQAMLIADAVVGQGQVDGGEA